MSPQEPSAVGISFNDQALLEKCRTVELLNKELYTRFAENYLDNPEAVYLWRITASEEENHAEQFTLALKLKKGLLLQSTISLETADKLIARLTNVIETLPARSLSLADALDFAIKLEQYLEKFHLSCIATFKDPSFESLFKAMMASDQGHIASIEAFHKKMTAEAAITSLLATG
jgi:hypothetical protein